MNEFTRVHVYAECPDIRAWLMRLAADQRDYIARKRYWTPATETAIWNAAREWCFDNGGARSWFDAIQCSAHASTFSAPLFSIPYKKPEPPKEEPTMDKPELVQFKIGKLVPKDKIVSDLVDALIAYVNGHSSPHAQYKSGQAGPTHIPVDEGMMKAADKAIKAAREAVMEEPMPSVHAIDKDKLIKQLATALKPFASLVQEPENLSPLDSGWNMSVKPRDVMNAQEALAVYENGDKLIHLDRLIKEYADSPDSPYYNSPKDTALIAEALNSLRADLSERG